MKSPLPSYGLKPMIVVLAILVWRSKQLYDEVVMTILMWCVECLILMWCVDNSLMSLIATMIAMMKVIPTTMTTILMKTSYDLRVGEAMITTMIAMMPSDDHNDDHNDDDHTLFRTLQGFLMDWEDPIIAQIIRMHYPCNSQAPFPLPWSPTKQSGPSQAVHNLLLLL